jgi:hypothetical protein
MPSYISPGSGIILKFPYQQGGLPTSLQGRVFDVFTEANCRKAFEASGLVPINAQVVLNRLEVRLRTPPASPLLVALGIEHV